METYHIPRDHILDTIEESISEVLTSRYPDAAVQVFLDEETLDMEIIGHSGPFLEHTRIIPQTKLTGVKNLHERVKEALSQAEVVLLARHLQRYRRQIRKGTIVGITSSGALAVEVKLAPNQEQPLVGTCPDWRIPKHEKGTFRRGDTRIFYVEKITTRSVKGIARLEITLDRMSKYLPELLLRSILWKRNPQSRVTCRRRILGKLIEIWTTEKVVPKIRDQIAAEFGEKVFILRGNSTKEIKEKQTIKRRKFNTNSTRKKKCNEPDLTLIEGVSDV